MNENKKKTKGATNCETCSHYVYDEEWDQYYCAVNLDEDDMYRFISGSFFNCPYYQLYDEYAIVRRQN